jgi:hypothetical protein
MVMVDPAGAEIYEGSRLIGKAPKVWTGAVRGDHELTFQAPGYHDGTGKLTVAKDGDEFSFKLRKVEQKAKPPPDLGIKAER